MSPQCEPIQTGSPRPVTLLRRPGDEESRTLEEALADRAEALIAAIPVAALVLNGRGVVATCNDAATRLLGTPLRGLDWSRLIIERFDANILAGETLRLKSGRIVTVDTSPLGYEPGQLLLLRDVTEQVRQSERAQQQQRLADMGRMAASLAHQIRTPLSTALLYASPLSSGSGDPQQQQRFATKLVASLRALEQLIHNILLFSRGDNGEEKPLDPVSLLSEVAATMQGQLEQAGIALECQGSTLDELVVINGNRTLLLSALQNLIGNAIHALAGSESGRISLAVTHGVDGHVELVVADNGPGIEATAQHQLFEPFVSHKAKGTGLGLAVVRAVARAHHGEVRVDSTPGNGATFTLTIPTITTQSHSERAGR